MKRSSSWLDRLAAQGLTPKNGDTNPVFAPDAPKRPASARSTAGRALRVLAVESQRSRLPQMAAALSYRTIFGLLPMIVVGLVVLKAFSSDQEIEHRLNQILTYAGLNTIGVTMPPTSAEPESADLTATDESVFFALPTPTSDVGPPSKAEVVEKEKKEAEKPPDEKDDTTPLEDDPPEGSLAYWVKDLVKRARTINLGAISAVGGIMLAYAAISMLVEIERAFNQIYCVPAGKSWIRRIFQYWTMLTLGTLLLFASFYFGEQFKGWVDHVVSAGGIDRNNEIWLLVSGYGITVLVSTTLILLVYLAVPNTRVRFVPALAGALIAAILWEAGKWGFSAYLRYSSSYAQLYGSLALIPLFLLWIYLTWFIVLLGLNISYHLQQARTGSSLALPGGQVIGWTETDAEPGVVDPTAALAMLEVIATGFREGIPVSSKRLAQRVGLTAPTTQLLLDRLTDRGFVHRVADPTNGIVAPGTPPADSTMYALARPPELIAAADVLRVGYEMSGMQSAATAAGEGVSPLPSGLVERLRRAQLEAAGQSSLASLMSGQRGAGGDGSSGSNPGNSGRFASQLGSADVIDDHSIPRTIEPLPTLRTRPSAPPSPDTPPTPTAPRTTPTTSVPFNHRTSVVPPAAPAPSIAPSPPEPPAVAIPDPAAPEDPLDLLEPLPPDDPDGEHGALAPDEGSPRP